MHAFARSFVIALVFAAPAANAATAEDEAARAGSAYEALDYEGCVSAAKGSLALPGGRAARVDAHRFLGLCKAALGDADGARDAFVEMLGVDAAAQLPAGLSPRFTSAFLEARGFWVGKTPVGIAIDSDEKRGRTRILTLAVNDDVDLIDTVAWRSADGDLGPVVKAAERMELEVPVDVAKDVVAFDAAGGVVVELALPDDRPPPVESAPTVAEATDESGSPLLSPWLWAGVAGAAVVVIGVAVAGIAVGAVFYEPRNVDLQTRVVFADN
jgi:hypothetical protein